ncbi:MAG TPA: DUF4403 family protein [Gemmatimonadales bacterium]|nr:DUF4403 family protein [Gemmatimonadales bacterium]
MLRTRGLFLCISIGFAGCGREIDAPEPAREAGPWTDTLPEIPPGTISAPLTLDLESALLALEAEVPRRFGGMNRRQPTSPGSRTSYAFEAEREPFAVRFAGDTIVLVSTVHYGGKGWYDPPVGPTVSGSCGTEDRKPRARLTLRVLAGLSPDWRLRTRTRLAGVEPLTEGERDQCEVSFLNIDVTGDVLNAAGGAIRGVLPSLDRRLARIDVRTPLESLWKDLFEPIRVTDSLWLMLRPRAVSLGPLSGSRETAVAQLTITAQPGFVSGPRPAAEPRPLPPLGRGSSEDGFALLVEGRFTYTMIGDLLTTKLRGQDIRTPGGAITLQSIEVLGLGHGRVGLGMRFRGSVGGRLWLVGSPVYDSASRLILVPDLDFDASSAGLLVRGLAWLKGDEIRSFLRREAWVPADGLLRELRELAERETNRDLAPGVRLGADITGTEPVGIHADTTGIILRARAFGTATLELGPELFRAGPAAEPERPRSGAAIRRPSTSTVLAGKSAH